MEENKLREPPDRGALERYVDVVRRLEAAAGERGRSFDLDGLFALAEYDEAREMAYAFGLVGAGLSADGFDVIDPRPAECRGAMPCGEVSPLTRALALRAAYAPTWQSRAGGYCFQRPV